MSETGKEDDQENKAVFAAIEGDGEFIGTGGILVRIPGGSRGGGGGGRDRRVSFQRVVDCLE